MLAEVEKQPASKSIISELQHKTFRSPTDEKGPWEKPMVTYTANTTDTAVYSCADLGIK